MKMTDRRTFLKMMGIPAAAAAMPLDLSQALAIPANNHHGSIQDVEHVVFLMQENRSFDHYFGTMRGVRGFADPFVARLPSGKPVWHQPNGAADLLPFRPNVEDLGETFLPDPPHGWSDTHAAWNGGKYDRWVPNKGVTTMTYHTRKDLPYQFALADAFTICDHYHCSLLGPTDPNRYHMWTGWVGNDGAGGGPVITNAEAGYDWSTYPERLQRAGISWKVYQDTGVGLDAAGFWGWTGDPYIGNYGDNALLYFHQYRFAMPGNPLADRAKTGTTINAQNRQPEHLMDIFREDVLRGRLPKVSWVVAPEAYTEHPNWVPDVGGWYVSQVIDALTKNPDVWSKTVLFIMYDEEGGFFDHMVPPTPPQTRAQGLSTVEITNEIFPGDAGHASGPYGLGIRVPMLVISPWSRGGWVNSQVFDHTSLIRFLEARFADHHPDLIETNVTPWRRTVVGDLTTAFDFKTPNASRRLILPSTADARPDLERHPDEVPVPPAQGALPKQEHGVKPARALPYTLLSHGAVDDGVFTLHFHNKGRAGVVFQVRSGHDDPRGYTVEPRKSLADTWSAPAGGRDFDLSVFGPNGFFRGFKARAAAGRQTANILIRERYDENDNEITLEFSNRSGHAVVASVLDNYTGHRTKVDLSPGDADTKTWPLKRSSGWYDFVVTVADDPRFEQRIAGHLENGDDSITDPAMGGLV